MKKIARLAVVFVFALSVTSCSVKKEETVPTTEESAGVLGSFESTDIEGNAVDATVFEGKKLTMVNIWATFCGPCINEMPDLSEIQAEYAEQGFQIVGIPADVMGRNGEISEDMLATAKEIVEQTGADYIHILPSLSLYQAKLQNVSAVPETIFVDEQGDQIGGSYIGSRSKEDWMSIIDSLLAEMQ